MVHSHGFEHGLILGSPLSKNTTKPWLWTTVLYAFITWLHTNGFTNVSFLLKTFGYIPSFVDIQYHASHQWFHQCLDFSTKPWLWTMVMYASITWLDTNGFTITFLHQFPWSTARVIYAHWTMPHTDGLSEWLYVIVQRTSTICKTISQTVHWTTYRQTWRHITWVNSVFALVPKSASPNR